MSELKATPEDNCLGWIECGGRRAREELVFLHGLLLDWGYKTEDLPSFAIPIGFSDIYRHPSLGDKYIRLEKAPDELLDLNTKLRAMALARLKAVILSGTR